MERLPVVLNDDGDLSWLKEEDKLQTFNWGNIWISETDPGVVTRPTLWVKLITGSPGDISLVLRIP